MTEVQVSYLVDSDPDNQEPVCVRCGQPLEWEECFQCFGKGGWDGDDLMAEDPLWYGPNDYEICDVCHGNGGYWFCTNKACPATIQQRGEDDVLHAD